MLQNNLKLAFRHLLKNKTYSLLNIAGLSVGVACAALILLWAEDEITFNAFHEKGDRIFQVLENQTYEEQTYTFSATPGLLAGAMKAEIPEVAQSTRMSWGDRYAFSLGDKSTFEEGFLVDSTFFDIFTCTWLAGDPKTALQDVNSLVISERMAVKFFGAEPPLGKTLKVNNKDEFKVTGVIENPPPNSSLKFDWLASFLIFEKKNSWWTDWNTNGMQTFVLLNAAADSAAVNGKLKDFIQKKNADAGAKPWLLALTDWHLRSEIKQGRQTGNGRIEYVRLFSIIAGFILLIACFNYMNLSTARSENRSREVGVRKVVGAGRRSLAGQFLGEALLTSALASLLALAILQVVLPGFNALVDKQLAFDFNNLRHLGGLLAVTLGSGLLAGSYPSFYLSSFRPLAVLKGFSAFKKTRGGGSATSIRKSLVVAQFCVSVFLIFCTIVVYRQISHVKNRHLGYDKNGVIFVEATSQTSDKFPLLKQELLATGVVKNAAQSAGRVIEMGSSSGGYTWKGKNPDADKLITMEWASPEYVKTLGMKLSAGRDFHENAALDSNSVIINQTFANLIRRDSKKDDLIGETITEGEGEDARSLRIVGVLEDFRFGDMYAATEPLLIFCIRQTSGVFFIRFKPGQDLTQAVDAVGAVFTKHNPGFPFDYRFLDSEFDRLFRSEATVGKLSLLFSLLAIFICCLGLFGLAAFAAERRTKEIGIRKVLGASVAGIVGLLAKEFLTLVVVSLVIATPLAWWAANDWLKKFEYHIQIQWWVFAAAGLLAVGIAFLTVSFQSVRAALANPVKSLRSE